LGLRAASAGTGGHAASRVTRRHGDLVTPSPAPVARPAGGAKAAPITFDQDNPYK
jgi:hypothetical protein